MKRALPEDFQKVCEMMLSGELDGDDVRSLLMTISGQGSLQTAVDTSERLHIGAALRAHHFDLSRTAEAIGLSQTTLLRKMQRLGISRSPSVST